jgi:GNAT superfamily N-acetyltransferase
VTIRPAVPADLAQIGALIRELAEYERLEADVTMTEDDLGAGLFGPRPYAEVLIAEEAEGVVGFALFFHSFSTFLGKPGIYLEDLFVRPAHRGQGTGRALLSRLAALAVERGCARMEWSVLDWNEPSIKFYVSLGAEPNADWTTFRLLPDAVARLATG